MKQPILFFLAIVFVLFGYVMLFTNFNSAPEKLNEVATVKIIDECYDDTMATWFVEFNESQENGANMNEADEKAAIAALINYDSCK